MVFACSVSFTIIWSFFVSPKSTAEQTAVVTNDPPAAVIEPECRTVSNLATIIADINTDRGLASTTDAADMTGENSVAVSVYDLVNDCMAGEFNGDQQFVSASTYKLYVAYIIINAIENGITSWSNNLNGTTLSQCFDTMIVESDNKCPEAFLLEFSFAAANDQIHNEIGVSERTVIQPGDMRTTANDLAGFLRQLYAGNLMSSSNQTKLLADMEQQEYRDGIPAGVDHIVADKTGFLDDYLHDAGIIYSPNGDYVLVVLTNGIADWSYITDIAKTVDKYM